MINQLCIQYNYRLITMNKQITTWKAVSKKERDTGYGDVVENSIKKM